MPEILVTDANILIDLAIVLAHELLLLPNHDVATTYEVFYELKDEHQQSWQPFIEDGRVSVTIQDSQIVDSQSLAKAQKK
jgi:hypothetical protein